MDRVSCLATIASSGRCPLCRVAVMPGGRNAEEHMIGRAHSRAAQRYAHDAIAIAVARIEAHPDHECALCGVSIGAGCVDTHVRGARHQANEARRQATHAQAASSAPRQPAAKAAGSAAAPAPAALSADADVAELMRTGFCVLCAALVPMGILQQTNESNARVHLRGARHQLRTKMKQMNFNGRVESLQGPQQGLSLELRLDQRVLPASETISLEVDQAAKLSLVLTNASAGVVTLTHVLAIPAGPLGLMGLDGRRIGRCSVPPGTFLLANFTLAPTVAQVGVHKALLAVQFKKRGLILLRSFEVSVAPMGSGAELLARRAAAAANPYIAPSRQPLRDKPQRVLRGDKPAALAAARDMYVVPLGFWDAPKHLGRKEDLEERLKYSLRLSNATYASRWHLLLHLEEQQMRVDIQSYDRISPFSRASAGRQSLWSFIVAGLAEQRPSVQKGDEVFVSSEAFAEPAEQHAPANARRMRVYSGFVHRVEAERVLLHFNAAFDRAYLDGSRWHVRFSFNRMPLRRQHQGVELVAKSAVHRVLAECNASSVAAAARAQAAALSPEPAVGQVEAVYMKLATSATEVDAWVEAEVLVKGVTAVGLDTESAMNYGERSSLALIQIATRDAVLLFRLLDLSRDELPQRLRHLLTLPSVTKYSVGAEKELEQEFDDCVLANHIDVQRVEMQRRGLKLQPGTQALADRYVPDAHFVKDKSMQTSNWAAWPLSGGQRRYAALDAFIALEIGHALFPAGARAVSTSSPPPSRPSASLLGGWLSSVWGSSASSPPAAAASAASAASPPLALKFRRNFNDLQQTAITEIVRGAHGMTPFIVFGPPGTGKTTVLVEAIQQLLLQPDGRKLRILACAPSNSAADLFVERLANLPTTDLLRVNALGRSVASTPEIVRKYSCVEGSGGDASFVLAPLERLKSSRVIVTTAVSASCLYGLGLKAGDITHVFIDEAGHATEPECMAALGGLVSNAHTRIILGGDPKQLGPIIRSPLALKHGLGTSILERLIVDANSNERSPYWRGGRDATGPYPSRVMVMLLDNYRSHPAILETPNRLFYQNLLQASADAIDRRSLCAWPGWPNANRSFPLLFHHVVGREQREGISPSWFNLDEAVLVIEYVTQLLGHKSSGLSPRDIGIITPYARQAQHLQSMAAKRSWHELKIGSVEVFQGQERRVILLSTVRSQIANVGAFDEKFNLGFVGQAKRLNVALTRAKHALIIVGNGKVLETDANWRSVLCHIERNRAVVGGIRFALSSGSDATGSSSSLDDADPELSELSNLLATVAALGSREEDLSARAAAAAENGSDSEADWERGGPQPNSEAPWKGEDS